MKAFLDKVRRHKTKHKQFTDSLIHLAYVLQLIDGRGRKGKRGQLRPNERLQRHSLSTQEKTVDLKQVDVVWGIR